MEALRKQGLSWGQSYFWRELVPQQGWSAPAQPSPPLLSTEVAPAPLDELRGHKALVKLRSRQERDFRELYKKHQRKAVALTRRLLDNLAQARAGSRCRQRPGVL